jgi:tetratricopeptide (TPR) repeat protein
MKMTDNRPKELIRAEELMYNGKVEEALEIVLNFEKRSELSTKDQLSALLLKGMIYSFMFQIKKAVEIGERAYPMSQELGLVMESIEALILKIYISFFGNTDEGLNLILEAEKLLNSLSDESSVNINKLKINLAFAKGWVYAIKRNFDFALDLALEAITLAKRMKRNVVVGYGFGTISFIYWHKGEHDTALEYAVKCLKLFEKLDFQVGIAHGLWLMGQVYSLKGKLNKALEFCKKCLSIEKVSDFTKVEALYVLGRSYRLKGELNKALKYAKQSAKLSEEVSNYIITVVNNRAIGEIYMMKREYNQAIKYFEQSLALSEKIGYTLSIVPAFLCLLLINLDSNSPEQAQKYLKRLENLSDQYESTLVKHGYPLGRALMLKTSSRMADHTDAARLLKQIVDDEIMWPPFHILAIVSLCELLLEELFRYNNPEVLDDINPLILQLLKIAEDQRSFPYLAEGKLLQAKLALIQMNIEEAKKLLTEAQNTAESHGLSLLSQKISKEHDNLLEQLDEWQTLKSNKAPISDRVKLASVDSVIGRLQGKRAVDPPEIIDEQPTLLMIISEGGVLIFSHAFTDEWKRDDELFGSFLSAFTSFSDDFFSEGLDRVKFGQHTVLLETVGSFSVCYLYKGQTYPAKQKLIQFTEKIQKLTSVWQTLNTFYKTSQVLESKDAPSLESLITEIFITKNPELTI